MSYLCNKASSLLPRQEKVSQEPVSYGLSAVFLALLPGQRVRPKKWLLVPHKLPTGEAHKPQEDPIMSSISLAKGCVQHHSGQLNSSVLLDIMPDASCWDNDSHWPLESSDFSQGLPVEWYWIPTGGKEVCGELKQCVGIAICHPHRRQGHLVFLGSSRWPCPLQSLLGSPAVVFWPWASAVLCFVLKEVEGVQLTTPLVTNQGLNVL